MLPVNVSKTKTAARASFERRKSECSGRLRNFVNVAKTTNATCKVFQSNIDRNNMNNPTKTAAIASRKKKQIKLKISVNLPETSTYSKTHRKYARSPETPIPYKDPALHNLSIVDLDQEYIQKEGPANLSQDICITQRVGKGASGTVYLGCFAPSIKIVAVKEIKVFEDSDRAMLMHELQALHSNLCPINEKDQLWPFHYHQNIGSKHPCPYIVSFYGAFANSEKQAVNLVMEYMDGGSLQDLVKGGIKSETILRYIALCLFRGIAHMHDCAMIHRDIKPGNILFNRRGDFKIADFGLAGSITKSKSFLLDFQGTVMYMAPERMVGGAYSYPSDIWAAGLAILTLSLGKFPFVSEDGFFGLEESIVNEPLPKLPLHFSNDYRDFILNLLKKDPMQRMTAKEALLHPFLTRNIEQSEMEFRKKWSSFFIPKKHFQSEQLREFSVKVNRVLAQAIHDRASKNSTFHRIKMMLHIFNMEIHQFSKQQVQDASDILNVPYSTLMEALEEERLSMNSTLLQCTRRHLDSKKCSLCSSDN